MEQQKFTRHLRSNMTESENVLWRHLRAHRLIGEKFRRQHPIGPYVVDFVHFGSRLIIEADGGQHNAAPHDEMRDAWLHAQGFRVMRFWNNDITGNLDGVLEAIMAAVKESPPLPCPSPARGEGENQTEQSPSPLAGEKGNQARKSPSPLAGEEGNQARKSPSPLAGEGLGRGEKHDHGIHRK